MSDVGSTSTPPSGPPPPGWYPDPHGATRWWDGSAWTEHVAPASPVTTAAAAAAAAATTAPAAVRAPSSTRTATIFATPPSSGTGSPGDGTPAPGRLGRLGRLGRIGELPQLKRLADLGAVSRRTWLVVGAVAALVVLVAGYLLFGRGSDDSAGLGVVPAATHPAAPAPAHVVTAVALTTKDLRAGLKAVLIPSGNVVKGQVTLDLCGYAFTTEQHRVARRQVEVETQAGQRTGVSNEVVVYDSVANATRAMAQWRAAASHCPLTYVKRPVPGEPAILATDLRTTTIPDRLVDDAVLTQWTEHVKGVKTPVYAAGILVRKGAVLDVIWAQTFTKLTPTTGLRTMATLSDVTAQRIPAS